METIHVVCAVIEHNECVLAAKRKEALDGKFWEFPGGKVEAHETSQEALRREINEELGITLESMWPLDTIVYTYDNVRVELEAFGTHLPLGATPELRVHDEFRWVEYGDLLTLDWLGADKQIAQATGLAWGELFYGSHGC